VVINKNSAVILSERRIQLSAEQQSDSILYELVTDKALTKKAKARYKQFPRLSRSAFGCLELYCGAKLQIFFHTKNYLNKFMDKLRHVHPSYA